MLHVPCVTAVITTRGRASLLPRALLSALDQTHPPEEVVVVVDGPDEDTEDFLSSVVDPRLRVITLDQSAGGCAARNIGVVAASTDWIAFLDDDDEWMPDKLSTQLELAAQSTAQYPIISCRVAATTPQGKTFLWPRRAKYPNEHLSNYLLARKTWTQGEGLVTTSMLMAPRELFLRMPFTAGLARHQEWDWLLRATASAEVELLIAWDVLATWNIEGERISISQGNDWRNSFKWIISMKERVTPRAYASFLMVLVSAIAAREGDSSALWTILEEARRSGRPGTIDYGLMAAMWLLPQKTRRRLRNLFVPQVRSA